jgi:transcriptional regulator with GAF, ATPase, and Fis domain
MLPDVTFSVSPAIVVWDLRPERATQIQRAFREFGITIRVLESSDETESPCHESGAVALVALGNSPAEHEVAFALIRKFHQSNYLVVAFEDGASRWPLARRCHVLLAGAKRIFDSNAQEFLTDLRRQVVSTLEEISSRIKEEESIRKSMRDLGVVGESSAMMAIERLVVRVSRLSDLPVLLSGETGTGKELLARAIHAFDPKRGRGPFVALNCAALSPDLAEAELFGHRRGAFTGAEYERKGLFRAAEGGVIFLDEIAELRKELQGKLLRVLQENRLLVLGEDRETAINVRLLAATNRDLRERVAQGEFRADLFHRLNVIPIYVPPLRERPEDVQALVSHFLHKHRLLNPASSRLAATEFIQGLQNTRLPGNARQVENVVRQAIARKEDDTPFGLADLPPELWEELSIRANPTCEEIPAVRKESPSAAATAEFSAFPLRLLEENAWNLSRSIRHFERLLLELALHRTHGNQSETARLLGITSRSIYNKLHQNPG